MYDFGFVALDILYTFPEDTGVYLCKATNKYGSDVNQVNLRCLGTLRPWHTYQKSALKARTRKSVQVRPISATKVCTETVEIAEFPVKGKGKGGPYSRRSVGGVLISLS